jgi:NAD(P)-dependent dehydrogenase (short-subunit alcohol dehydrogenase family)
VLLAGRVVAMTGASGALGGTLARAFAREGSRLVLGYCTQAETGDRLATEIGEAGGAAIAVHVAVEEPEQVEVFVRACVEKFGRLDVLFNCAGGLERRPFLDTPPTLWRQTFARNVDGAFHGICAAARQMIRQGTGGKIVNMSSIAAIMSTDVYVPYCAAKAALDQLTRGAAAALAPHGITVNALAPGTVETDKVRVRLAQGVNRQRLEARTPGGRLVRPEDLGGVSVFLASHLSDHLTGQIITVDHGFTLVGVQWDA